MTRPDPASRDAQRVIDALGELFDELAPHDRAAAEQELHDAGVDPDAVATRFARLAPPAAPRDGSARQPRQLVRPAATAARPRRLLVGAIAALLVGGFAWFLGGDAVLRSARRVPQLPDAGPDRPFSAPPRRPVPPLDSRSRPSFVTDEPAGPATTVHPATTPRATPARPTPDEWAAPMPPDGDTLARPDARSATADGTSWILDSTNWQQAEGLLPPVVLDRVKKGDYWYKVAALDPKAFRTNYSKKFWAASAANADRYDVDPQTCGLKDVATGKVPEFYFGYPFPTIDPKDPLAACKMAWNFDAANSMGEGQGATFTLNGIDTSGEFKRVKLWLHTLAFLGRHGGPIDNPEGLRAAALANALEPTDIDGVGGLTKRVNDWDSPDKIWLYVPATRRVRRPHVANRSSTVAGLDIFPDDLNCYGGKVEYYKWTLVGEQTILAPIVSPQPLPMTRTNSPSRFEVSLPHLKAAYEAPAASGVPWLLIDNLVLVPRPVWVLEGESTDPYYAFGKVVMYMDKDMYRIYWKLVHNRAGEYFYNAMCGYHFSKSESES
ncbi:MAG: DUF1329 domain-containing protein, partial [Deltaproteobacteria bacterium]|nr:DUF1329 domain-containing protein [Deltaproteobacteria bacterium]